MSLTISLRRGLRALPFGRPMLDRIRKLSGPAFAVSAYARYGWRRKPGGLASGPVVVVGFHDAVLGLGDGVRAFSAALRQAGIEVIDWDISESFGHERRLTGGATKTPPAGVGPVIVHLNPREMVQLVAMFGGAPFAGRRVIGYWAWELEHIPRAWSRAFRYVDEVWTPSQFVADAVLAAAPAHVAVRVFPHLVSFLPRGRKDRARFGLPEDRFVVLTSFDVRSGFVRKHPLAALAAARGAAAQARGPMTLVCKIVGREGAPDLVEALEREADGAEDIRLIFDWLSGQDMADLIASADAVMSLHRSEGFGLLPAQAMLAGKPVLATGWSGNMEFMDAETSRLVDYDLVPVEDVQGLYAGGHWAEPDVEDAARKLARLVDAPEEAAALGARARQGVLEKLDPEQWGRVAAVWLDRSGG
jgi:glycosyltransferase involved in cell wall biosynthesis